jgi:hypothetical protein
VVKITIEVPEELVGDIYLAVGRALQLGQDELDEAAERADGSERNDADEPEAEA